MTRSDPDLIRVIEEMGRDANGLRALLKIVEIPLEYETCYEIQEYDGWEGVVCDPKNLVEYELKNTDINSLNEDDLRGLICRWKDLVSQD